MPLSAPLRALRSFGQGIARALRPPGSAAPADDPAVAGLLLRAREARLAGRPAEAAVLYRQVLQMSHAHVEALRALRDLAVDGARWLDALDAHQRLVAALPSAERSREAEWLAIIHYEAGRGEVGRGNQTAALAHFRSAARADRGFLPVLVALGDAHAAVGDGREAARVWERAVEAQPVLPILVRLERLYREEGRPSRMIALYRAALERAPDDLAIAVSLGRVLFELEMLDEAADQFEKIEVKAPELPVVHAYLGAVFERRGQTGEAFEEYRRALRLAHVFDWTYRCEACGAAIPGWHDRCPRCQRWNTLRPARA